ncbi:MAG TPA: DUF6444 domain-containing protein [Aggregatilineaceae bacterium]|nr:DUF6444 domain-containing protein [Aggregatilineaceae bacterium]
MSGDLISPPNSGISPEDWQQTPPSVRVWVTVMAAEIKQLKETVEKLQEMVKRNSQNSSQPPSQDRPDQKPVKENPASRASEGDNRVTRAIIGCWSLSRMRSSCTNRSAARGVGRCC